MSVFTQIYVNCFTGLKVTIANIVNENKAKFMILCK